MFAILAAVILVAFSGAPACTGSSARSYGGHLHIWTPIGRDKPLIKASCYG